MHRILVRHGLVVARPRRKRRSEYVRWQRPAAMQLWQLDILFGPMLVDTLTGELRQARIVTGLDDHSRYCVLARVVEARNSPRDAAQMHKTRRHSTVTPQRGTPARSARRSHGRSGRRLETASIRR